MITAIRIKVEVKRRTEKEGRERKKTSEAQQ